MNEFINNSTNLILDNIIYLKNFKKINKLICIPI